MNRRFEFFIFLILFSFSCSSSENLDSEGLASSESAFEQFTRASQLYYRGRLTAAMDEFNGVIYKYPDSPMASDARLALRRLESDLAGEEYQEHSTVRPDIGAHIAVIGRPAVNTAILTISAALRSLGADVSELIDDQAPPLTVVFYNQGYDAAAATVADSLGAWLSYPETFSCRPGDELIGTVANGFDVLVIVGNDAVFASSFSPEEH